MLLFKVISACMRLSQVDRRNAFSAYAISMGFVMPNSVFAFICGLVMGVDDVEFKLTIMKVIAELLEVVAEFW